jgi:hypothetical protein
MLHEVLLSMLAACSRPAVHEDCVQRQCTRLLMVLLRVELLLLLLSCHVP